MIESQAKGKIKINYQLSSYSIIQIIMIISLLKTIEMKLL
jgi:hypothetical protein